MTITELKEKYCNFEGLFLEDKALICSIISLYIGLGKTKPGHLDTLLAVSSHIERYVYDDLDEVNEFLEKIINQGFTESELLEICRELLA